MFRGRWVVAGVALLALVLLAALVVRRPVLASVSVTHDALQGLDRDGVVLWQHAFGILNEQAYADGGRRSWIGNLGGNPVVLFVPVAANMVTDPVPLVCLDHQGREQWRFTPGKTVTRNRDVFAPPFVVRQFAVIGDKIVVTSHHHLYYPSQVAVLDTGGHLLREYWHPGHLNVLTTGTYGGRPTAFLGGINNVRHAATLVALDPEQLSGAALEKDQPAFDNMPRGNEVARLLFPRSGINQADPYNVVIHLLATPGEVIADVRERLAGADPPSILYHLDDHLNLRQVVVSDVFQREFTALTNRAFTISDGATLRLTRIR